MPNTLVHCAVQGITSRGLWPRSETRWVYLGCLLPDMPWILRRAVTAAGLPVDPADLRLYTLAQASLAGTLLLAAALALLAAAPRRVFGVLGVNTLLHLLLDACEIKWGNGVHLAAPFSWRLTNFGLLPGEHAAAGVLAATGALLLAWELRRQSSPLFDPRPRRLVLAAACTAAYLGAPWLFLAPLEASDSDSVKTVREVAARTGRTVQFDRAIWHATPGGGRLEIWSGEHLRVSGLTITSGSTARVSLRGTFLAPDRLHVERFVEHRQNRDWPSYAGLVLVALVWLRPYASRSRRAGGTAPPNPHATA